MSDDIFYVYPEIGQDSQHNIIGDRKKKIAAKFLFVNGKPVVDPNPQRAMKVNLYRRLNADGTIDESSIFSNTHNYLIVPANYDPSEAVNFAAGVNSDMTAATAVGGGYAGTAVGLAEMTSAFWPGHEQDLQRGERWGIPHGERAPAFKDAASWNLGYVTQMLPLPNEAAVMGGGGLNVGEFILGVIKEHLRHGPTPTQRLDGPMGMSETDYRAFLQGVEDAKESEKAGISSTYHWPHKKFLDGLNVNTPLQKLQHYGKQARTAAAKKPVPEAIKRHNMFLKAGHSQSFAPVRRKDAALATNSRDAAAGYGLSGLLNQIALQAARNPAMQMARGRADGQRFSFAPPGRMALPSIAPHAQPARFTPPSPRAPLPPAPSAATALEAFMANPPAFPQQLSFAQEMALRNAVGDHFAQQSRLPPNGYTGFDPRLSPAWPALKLLH